MALGMCLPSGTITIITGAWQNTEIMTVTLTNEPLSSVCYPHVSVIHT